MKSFITHTKEIVAGKRLDLAIESVRDDLINLAHSIRISDEYASHITEAEKDNILNKSLERYNNIHLMLNNFTIWQRVNEKLTGECIALLQKNK